MVYRISTGGHIGTFVVQWGLMASCMWLTLSWGPIRHFVPITTRTLFTNVIYHQNVVVVVG